MMDPPATMMEFIRNGRLRALAVSSAQRYFALPDVPTLAQAGVAGFDVTGWQGLIAPAGLAEPIVSRLNSEVRRILAAPATIERLHAFGNAPSPCSPEEFKARIESEIAKWTAVVEQIHFAKI
jgi:tripartite-type tricarboxylate transporter receptor subunit TctC